MLDLDYAEDSAAQTDANFVLTWKGDGEIQGTPKAYLSARTSSLHSSVSHARIARLVLAQKEA